MAECDDGPVTVGHVEGTAVPFEDRQRVRVRAVGPDAGRDAWRSVDCAFLVGADGLDVLAEAGHLPVPTLLYDPDDDPTVAARATRLSVNEYVPAAPGAGRSLAERVRAVVGDDADDRHREDAARRALDAVATDASLGIDTKIDRLLRIGRERLDIEVGYLTRIEDDTLTVEAESGDHPVLTEGETVPLSAAHCRRVLQREEFVDIHDVAAMVPADDPARERWDLGCYLGEPVVVDGEPYGTLCFASETPRRAPSASERTFVELLGGLISYEIGRDRRERSLRRYRAVHEAVEGMVFVVGREARLELATQPLVDRFGYDRTELLGRPLTDLLGDDVVRTGYEALETLQTGAESVSIEVTARTADDEPVPVSVELSLLSSESEFEGLVGVVIDRSELTETRAELAAQRDRFQHLFDRVPDAVVDVEFVDGQPVVRAVNAAFEETFEADADGVVGRPLNAVVGTNGDGSGPPALDDGSMWEPDVTTRFQQETADGRRTFLVRGFRYPGEGTERAFGIYTDVTEQLEQQQRLRVLHRVLRHNLRNEMNAIIGYADLLAASGSESDDAEYSRKIRITAADVAELSDQVRFIEQALDREREPTTVDAARVVADVVEEYPEGSFRVVDDEAVPAVADGLLELAVETILDNAVEHVEDPTVEIEIAPADADPDTWVDVVIRDDGPGIPDREQAVVAGHREITQVDHSRGLGLWVTRWILEGVGGRLVFGDQADGGSVVLRLRRADAEADGTGG